MVENINQLKEFLIGLKRDDIIFKSHFYEKKEVDRKYLTEDLIIDSLKNIKNLLRFEEQIVKGEKRYRIWIRLSGKYNLILISQIKGKNLYIITAWKTNRKWEKEIQK